ncbi:MAG: hypothetical protein DMG92_10425 [Acidobacteria bacterium]|nr:MAG: hypothetical protein DMG92_10425 [Acidobacteriota bacterium]
MKGRRLRFEWSRWKFWNRYQAAVIAFQQSRGLQTDGIIGPTARKIIARNIFSRRPLAIAFSMYSAEQEVDKLAVTGSPNSGYEAPKD